MLQASLHDIQWLGHAGRSRWCIYWVSRVREFQSNEERGMSLKCNGSRIGLLDEYLRSPCTIMSKGSKTGVSFRERRKGFLYGGVLSDYLEVKVRVLSELL